VERRFVNIVRISGKLLILEIKIIKPFKNDWKSMYYTTLDYGTSYHVHT
jgi:hypothetical protein